MRKTSTETKNEILTDILATKRREKQKREREERERERERRRGKRVYIENGISLGSKLGKIWAKSLAHKPIYLGPDD